MSHNLLKGKRGIIFGALNDMSIAWKVAEKAVEEGATITLSNTPIAVRMGQVDALAEKLHAEVIPADATSVEDLETVFSKSVEILGGKIDFVLHSIGMSPNVRKKRKDTGYLRNLFSQDVAGCQKAGCHCRIRFSDRPLICGSTTYILRI